MLSKEKKLEITEQVVNSNTFMNAPTSIAILKYLVEANIEGRFLKEGIIDHEFFGAEPGAHKSTPRVRVNIYNLRKKLKNYYESEGGNDLWQIKLDKGQYSIRFERMNPKLKYLPLTNFKKLLPYLLTTVAVGLLIITHLPPSKPLLWEGFFDDKHSTNLFIGDAFGYGGQTISGLPGWTRDFSINSLDEYYKMLENKPELKLLTKPTDFNYSTRMAEHATHDFARLFTLMRHDFEIKYATNTSFADIKKGNTIYIGRLKEQKKFFYLFNEGNKYFKIQDNQVHFLGKGNLPDTTFIADTENTESDYALVSRIPGPNNTEQFFFFSNHDIGVMATVEYFTNPDSLKAFTEKYLNNDIYFTAIYKAKGKERINLNLEEILVVPFD
ncbi:hypothetical protein GCM10028791_41910 [Echinicola sediminis]